MNSVLARKKLSSFLSISSSAGAGGDRRYLSSPDAAAAAVSALTPSYLITSCFLPSEKATKICNLLSPKLSSTFRPSSVLLFLKEEGFTESHIRAFISGYPNLLCANPNRSLRPNLLSLRSIPSLSPSALLRLLLYDPSTLRLRAAVARISFWMKFLGGDEKRLIRAFQNNRGLVRHHIDDSITPKIQYLRTRGFDDIEIARIVQNAFLFITSSPDRMDGQLKRVEDLGFVRGTKKFVHGFRLVTCVGDETLRKKMELMARLGWSEDEFFAALQRAPTFATLSEKNLEEKMKFLVGEAGLDPSWIASHSNVLGYSLEKRIMPRYRVLDALESKGLIDKRQQLQYACCTTDAKFIERYVLPWKEDVPELHGLYVAASSG